MGVAARFPAANSMDGPPTGGAGRSGVDSGQRGRGRGLAARRGLARHRRPGTRRARVRQGDLPGTKRAQTPAPAGGAGHRRVAGQCTGAAPARRYDDGDWVALVLQDIPGRNPATPWRADELAVALATLDELVRTLTPAPLPDLPAASEALADDFAGWRRIAEDPPAELHPWVTQRLDQLCRLEQRALAAVDGDTLVHRDIRADNLLLRPDGGATVVDWPRACRGAALGWTCWCCC